MRNGIRAAIVGLCGVSVLTVPASGASAQAVICAGDTETVSWTAPADTSGLTGYVVTVTPVNDECSACGDFPVATVPLDQTSVTVTLGAGGNCT